MGRQRLERGRRRLDAGPGNGDPPVHLAADRSIECRNRPAVAASAGGSTAGCPGTDSPATGCAATGRRGADPPATTSGAPNAVSSTTGWPTAGGCCTAASSTNARAYAADGT